MAGLDYDAPCLSYVPLRPPFCLLPPKIGLNYDPPCLNYDPLRPPFCLLPQMAGLNYDPPCLNYVPLRPPIPPATAYGRLKITTPNPGWQYILLLANRGGVGGGGEVGRRARLIAL